MNKDSVESVVSCTTDGFISSTPFMDEYKPLSTEVFSNIFYEMRLKLTGKGSLLEKKYEESKGVISWRTRGQLGLSGGIKALTGYQRNEPIEQTIDKVIKSFNGTKTLAFIQKSLRSAKDIYLEGGHCTLKLSERNFNLKFDNRREINEEKGSYCSSKPFNTALNSVQARLISNFGSSRYRLYAPISKSQCQGDAYLSLTKRMLVRYLRESSLSRIEISKIMKEIGLPCTLNFISKQKNKKPIYNSIPSTEKTLKVLENLSVIFPTFNSKSFVRN